MQLTENSQNLFKKSKAVIPGGVNSPVRSFNGVGGNPLFIAKGQGAFIFDADGQAYLDYVGSWGASILGHAHPRVVQAVQETAELGLSFGAPTELEWQLSQLICESIPSIEKIRLVSSGTEACMSAIRLARAYTQKNKIVKFSGNYHGHSDCLLVKSGSGIATLGIPGSPGVPADVVRNTLSAPYNDPQAVELVFREHGADIAAVIVEPYAGNAGFIKGSPEFLQQLRSLCDQYEALLIFDEVMTGFRTTWGGVQNLQAVKPDLTTLGKVIGGGLPLAAYGGSHAIMNLLAPEGPVYQAGTLSGNPLAVRAGLETLRILQDTNPYPSLHNLSKQLVEGLVLQANNHGVELTGDFCGGMFGIFFCNQTVKSFEEASKSNTLQFQQFFHKMLAQKIYMAPSAFEAGFLSTAHSQADIESTLEKARQTFVELKDSRI